MLRRPRQRSRFRLGYALGIAAALHVGVLAMRIARPTPLEPTPGAGDQTGIELELDAVEESPQKGSPETAPDALTRADDMGRRSRASSSRGAAETRGHSSAGGDPGNGAASGEEGAYVLDPRASTGEGSRAIDLGLKAGDWSKWAGPNAGAPAPAPEARGSAPAPISSTGGLQEALEAHDQEIGLGPAGAVLSAVQEGARSEVAPALGRARFEVTILRSGLVDVKLTHASGDPARWSRVAEVVTSALKRKPPRVPGPRNGVRLGIEVLAREQMPDGSSPQGQPPALELVAPSFKAVDESKEELARRNPLAAPSEATPHADRPPLQANVEPPGVFVKGGGRVCGYRAGVSLFGPTIGGGCEPANIGARPTRVVSTHVVNQSLF